MTEQTPNAQIANPDRNSRAAPAWAGAKRLPGGRQALTVLAHGRKGF